MHIYRRAALSVLASFVLAGCARMPVTQPLSRNHAAAIQPVDVKIGIKQPELYASFEPSRAGQSAAAACGAIPGLGILLAAACGGAAGAMDASINATRAKAADETIRPLKDELVDLKFDQLMNESVTKSLQGVPGMQLSAVGVTKTVDDKTYEELVRASTSNAVMFVNVDYHISKDFSTLDVSARGLVYPRSASARSAAGFPVDLPLPDNPQEKVLDLKNTVYRVSVFYHAKLPIQAEDSSAYIAAWKANNGQLLRSGLLDGTAHVTRLLAEDLQRAPEAQRTVLSTVDVDKKLKADVIAESTGGQLLRYPDGSLHFKATMATSAETATPLKPVAAK